MKEENNIRNIKFQSNPQNFQNNDHIRNIKNIKEEVKGVDNIVEPGSTHRDLNREKKVDLPKSKTRCIWITIFISVGVVIVIGAIIAIILYIRNNKNKINESETTETNNIIDKETIKIIDESIIPEYIKKNGPIEMQTEYKINTNLFDLKRIYINQKYYEDIKIDGVLTQNLIDRKTNYDIFIIEKNDAPDEAKYFYNFTYLCAIAISSECVSSKDQYCIPKKLVDLNDQDNSQLRNLKQIDSLENFPIPICFFNITDNNVITSIRCHKKLNESKINSIVLDLYFFRPPGIKRINKEETNVTITQKKIENNIIIRETNGGICDIDDPIGTFCSTDMNTTKDSEGNLIAYDEVAFTNITRNIDNYYIKNKITQLLDKTSLSELNKEKYNITLNKLYQNLKNYLKYYEHFSLDNFRDLYNVSKGLPNEAQERRRLYEEKSYIVNQRNLFNFSHYGGVNIKISLKDNLGYNTQAMEASNILQIDDKKVDLAILKEFTNIDNIIKKLINLSKAGNNLATILYNKIKENLNNITTIISFNIPSMNTLLAYKELSDIFDSTYSIKYIKIIPYNIIEESDNLINKLEEIYNGINNGALKSHIVVLNKYIYQFIKQSHILINKISNNLKELGDLIKSPKQTISDISNYYMNHTSISYINTIKEAEKILMYYYENEKDLIVPKVKEILEKFENLTFESVQKQINLINNLNQRFENKEIEIMNSKNLSDYEKIIINLHNSNNYISNIIKLFKKKVENEMELKNGYFISQYDISSNNETFTRIIDEALVIAKQLDDNEYVDKLFDEIMTNFRISFINITKDMENERNENFVPSENILKDEYLKISEQQNISQELKNSGLEIILKIKNENSLFLDTMDKVINEFLDDNRDYLNQLMNEINILFSIDSLDNIAKSYEKAFNRHLNKITNGIAQNKKLAYEYIDDMAGLMTDNNKVIDFLGSYEENFQQYKTYTDIYCSKIENQGEYQKLHCINNTFFKDRVTSKKKGKEYYSKFSEYKKKFDIPKNFINSDLHSNILNEYKNLITKLKGILQTFKNNKLSDKYPDYTNLFFIDNHIKNIDELYNRLNRYISDDIFNNYYFKKIQEYKNNEIKEINNITLYIENQNKKINIGNTGKEKDFCTTFKRKRTFTCRNGAIYNFDNSEDQCFYTKGSNNLGKMIEINFNNDKIFEDEFNKFYSSIKSKIDSYNNLISKLKESMISVEEQIINKKITNNYLSSIENKINLILNDKYSDNLIKGSHNYYKNLLVKRLENIFNNISNQWIDSFDNLKKNVNNNLNNFRHSMNEFGIMSLIYEAVISQNLTKIFYDSLIKQQMNEFNYTISYYYNCLLQNITSVYQYIFNQIPTNQEGFNNILNLRKEEIKNKFNHLLNIVKESKSDSLSINKQIYVLQVSSSNFFGTNSIITQIIKETSSTLKTKGNSIYKLKNGKKNDEFSLASRFYLENSLNGLQIEEYYQPVNEKDPLFISLDEEKFIELLSNNWIFDQDDFINQLNISIYNSNLDIKNDFSIKRDEYYEILEQEITKYQYSKENISQKLYEEYSSNIKEIDEDKKNKTFKYIQVILNEIKNQFINERNRMTNKAVSYTNDFSKINDTVKKYKKSILNKLEEIITNIVDNFHEKLLKEKYKNIIESGLDIYLSKAENYITECKTFETLNSSYNIGNVIYEIVKDLTEEYKNFSKRQFEFSHEFYIEKLKNEIGMKEIEILIDNEINLEYSKLLNLLKIITKDIGSGSIGYSDYDLSEDIKNNINNKIIYNFENINNTLIEIIIDSKNPIPNGWENLNFCFDSVDSDIFFNKIDKDFQLFINKKISFEKDNINKFLKDIIRNNFNTILNNLISTFGIEFFERMVKYNENFKISSLYQNLKYSLVISLNYYQMLYNIKKDINALSNDLKIKLYNLNNLDKIAEDKNKIILEMLDIKAEEFIEKSMNHLLKDYKSFLMSDTSIQLAFSKNILQRIESNLKEISPDLEKDYKSLLNEVFKKKFINYYIQKINEQTKDMIQTINELKEGVKSIFDDLFSLDIEQVLNQTNYQMNITLDSIEEYKNYFNTFKLPEELTQYLLNYGEKEISPCYEKFESLINKETKYATLNNIEIKSSEFEQYYKTDEMNNRINLIYSSIENNNNIIKNEIDSYGNKDYPTKLQNEINRLDRRSLRRLNNEQTNEDKEEEYQEKIADKSIDENFRKLLNISQNTNRFIQTDENFDNLIKEIERKKKKLTLSYKQSQQIINEAFQEDDAYPMINDKLQLLYNLSFNYYNEIKGQIVSLRNYTEISIAEIDKLLNECANITYQTFADKYNEISNEAESIDKIQDNNEKDIPIIAHISYSQNTEYNTEASIIALIKKARFKFSFILDEEEGNIKKPKILAIVNNEIKPEQIKFKISNDFGECGQNYQTVDVKFNKVNYTIVLNFDTKSTLINVTTITDFDAYDYIVARYMIEDSESNYCSNSGGIGLCVNECEDYNIRTIDEPKRKKQNKIFKNEETFFMDNGI